MSSLDLFGFVAPPPRGRHYVEPKGYAGKPGAGPEGETCGSCEHLVRSRESSRPYPKCNLIKASWTKSRRTDVLVRSPACNFWVRRGAG